MTQPHGSERTAGVIVAVIGAVAALAVAGVVAFSSDKSSGSALPGSQVSGNPSGAGGIRVGGGPNSGAASGGGSALANRLRQHFPLPPGATLSTDTTVPPGPGETDYQVRAGLDAVKSYYQSQLSALGVTWTPTAVTLSHNGASTVDGWHGGIYADGNPPLSGSLYLDENYLGRQPGIVRIAVTIY